MRNKKSEVYKLMAVMMMFFTLTACTAKTYGPFEYAAPSSDRTVTIVGKKATPLAPIMVGVDIKVAKGANHFALELAAFELSQENIKVEWESADKGRITLTQSDGSTKVLNMELNDELIHVIQDINPNVF